MTEVTFLDGLDPCLVHGHTPVMTDDWHTLDIVGNMVKNEICSKCGKTRRILKTRSNLRDSVTMYPDGEWR